MDTAVLAMQSHLDLVAFIYGAAFVLLAALLLAFPRGAPSGLPARDLRLLALFALLHGFSEWAVTVALLAGQTQLQLPIRLIGQLLANVFLFEFGRRVFARQFDRADDLGRWLAPLGAWWYAVAAAGLVGFLAFYHDPIAGGTIWLRYSLAFTGGLLAGLGLWRLAGSEQVANRPGVGSSLRFAAAAVLVYAVGAGLVTYRAEFFPASWLNREVFVEATYVPIELARALIVMMIAAAFARLLGVDGRRVRQQFERELARVSRRGQQILDATGEGIIELDLDARVRYANPAVFEMLQASGGGLIGRPIRNVIADAGVAASIEQAVASGESARATGVLFRPEDEVPRPVDYLCTPVRDGGTLTGTVLSFRDVSERQGLLELLRETQALGHIGGWSLDAATGKASCTEEVSRIYELPADTELDLERLIGFYHPDSQPVVRQAVEDAIRSGEGFDLELKFVTARGRSLWVRAIGRAHLRDGQVVRLSGTLQDVTERKTTEQALRDATDFYELVLDSVPVRIAYVRNDERIVYINRSYEEWFQTPRASILNKRIREITSAEAFAQIEPRLKRVLAGEPITYLAQIKRKGELCELEVTYLPHLSRNGEVLGFFSVVQDITERKQLEAKLMQAQKMEAVGQLTGGVAHDFNNLLSVILGNLQLLERPLRGDAKLHKKVKTATRAALRGADLTRRLLAFARRQQLDPVVLNLNSLLLNLDDLLRRTLGETIEVTTVLARDLWQVKVDPGQMENAILNLAINARDAMPEGGQLTIETANVVIDQSYVARHPGTEAGEFLVVAVSDTGCGIEPQVLKQVFEPFFTTKEVGKGSGLGLSMVYGFAEQSGGHASIYSEVGHGTTVKIYLPRAMAELPASRADDSGSTRFMPGGDETILVVEDEDDVRETVVSLLRELGYEVLEAANGRQALELIERHGEIELVFTDVMMPGGMHGPVLAAKALELRPDLKILFTSGYAESAILHRGLLVASSELIGKPYKNSELALKIRLLLDKETVDG